MLNVKCDSSVESKECCICFLVFYVDLLVVSIRHQRESTRNGFDGMSTCYS